MTRIIIVALVSLSFSTVAFAKNPEFYFTRDIENPSCRDYLDAYSRTKLIGENEYKGPYEAWEAFGWINGYVTAVNRNVGMKTGHGDVTDLSENDTRRWVASWCRDNPKILRKLSNIWGTTYLEDAVRALIKSREGK